jgi:hypothetical protein
MIASLATLTISGMLILSTGEVLKIPRPSSQIWLSKTNIVEASPQGSSLILKGRQPGLVVAAGLDPQETKPTSIVVLSPENASALKRCSTLVDISPIGVPAPKENTSIQALAQCRFQTLGLSESAQHKYQTQIQEVERSLFKQGFPSQKPPLWAQGQRNLFLRAPLNSQTLSRIRQILGLWAPFFTFTETTTSSRPGRTLVFEITLFEFSRSRAMHLGVSWPRSIVVQPLEAGQTFSGADGTLKIGADFGESLGLGRILARPQVRTKPGEKATFQSGGEIPIRSSNALGSSTVWKNYGLMVSLTPGGDIETGDPEVTVQFQLELSEPDFASAIDGIPGMKVRRLESRFDLRTEESTVLTTLIQTRSGNNRVGLPGTEGLGIFDILFGSRQRFEEDSELWFALRPSWESIHAL